MLQTFILIWLGLFNSGGDDEIRQVCEPPTDPDTPIQCYKR